MNAEQIIKALECCVTQGVACRTCPAKYDKRGARCYAYLKQDALSLIKELTQAHEMLSESYDHLEKTKDELLAERSRLTEENERLMRDKTALECIVSTARNQAKADTVRKMQEQLKMEIDRFGKKGGFVSKEVVAWFIDQIAKEILKEEEKNA